MEPSPLTVVKRDSAFAVIDGLDSLAAAFNSTTPSPPCCDFAIEKFPRNFDYGNGGC
jgi:hypothetical protein